MALTKSQTRLVNTYREMFAEEHDRQPELDDETILKVVQSIEDTSDEDTDDEQRISAMLDAEGNGNGDVIGPKPTAELTGDDIAKMAAIEKEQVRSARALAVKFDSKAITVAREVVKAGETWKGGAILFRKELLRLYGKDTEINGHKFRDLPDFPNVGSEKGSNKIPVGPNGLFDRYTVTRQTEDGGTRQMKPSWYGDFAEATEYGAELLQSKDWKIGPNVDYKTNPKVPAAAQKLPVPEMRKRKKDDDTNFKRFVASMKKGAKFHTRIRDILTHLGDKVDVFVSDTVTTLCVTIQQKGTGNSDMFTVDQVMGKLNPLAASQMGGDDVIANLNHTLEREPRQTGTETTGKVWSVDMSVDTLFDGLNTSATWYDPKSETGKKHIAEVKRKLAGAGSDVNVLIFQSLSQFCDAVWTDGLLDRARKLNEELDPLSGEDRAKRIAAMVQEAQKPSDTATAKQKDAA